jgi:hypothetical protein
MVFGKRASIVMCRGPWKHGVSDAFGTALHEHDCKHDCTVHMDTSFPQGGVVRCSKRDLHVEEV